jgi:hypothetical protein
MLFVDNFIFAKKSPKKLYQTSPIMFYLFILNKNRESYTLSFLRSLYGTKN